MFGKTKQAGSKGLFGWLKRKNREAREEADKFHKEWKQAEERVRERQREEAEKAEEREKLKLEVVNSEFLNMVTEKAKIKGVDVTKFKRTSVIGFEPGTKKWIELARKGYLTYIDTSLVLKVVPIKYSDVQSQDFPVNLIWGVKVNASNANNFFITRNGIVWKNYSYFNSPLKEIKPGKFPYEQEARIDLPICFGNPVDKYDIDETIYLDDLSNLQMQIDWNSFRFSNGFAIKKAMLYVTEYGFVLASPGDPSRNVYDFEEKGLRKKLFGEYRKQSRMLECDYNLGANLTRHIEFPTGFNIQKIYLLTYAYYGENYGDYNRDSQIIDTVEISLPYESKKVKFSWYELEKMSVENKNIPVCPGGVVIELSKLNLSKAITKESGLNLVDRQLGEVTMDCFAKKNGQLSILYDGFDPYH